MTPGGRPAFAHLFTAEHKGLLLVALRCLGRIAGPQVADALHELSALWSQAVHPRPDCRGTRTAPDQRRGSVFAPPPLGRTLFLRGYQFWQG
jgi:hypothetical protein